MCYKIVSTRGKPRVAKHVWMENTLRQSNGNYGKTGIYVVLGRQLLTVLDISEQNTQKHTHTRYKCLSSTFHLYYRLRPWPWPCYIFVCLGRGDSDSATMML